MFNLVDSLSSNTLCWMSFYVVIQFIFYFGFEKNFFKNNPNDNCVLIADKHELNFFSISTFLVEYFVLNRYSFFGYKNHVKSNLRIMSSFMLTIFISISAVIFIKVITGWEEHCFNLSVKEIFTLFFGFLLSSFIIERKSLYEKWMYLSGVFNKIVENECKDVEAEDYTALRACLALDILDMEMWSHASFRGFFKGEVDKCNLDPNEKNFKKSLRDSLRKRTKTPHDDISIQGKKIK